ncbi:MAG TPA: phage portal protein [Stellaceae bacterium]|nr:phage portal protein [Stellaceae bacterium]
MLDGIKNFVFGRFDAAVPVERSEPVLVCPPTPAPTNLSTRMLEAASPHRGPGAPVSAHSPWDWSGSIVAGLETVKQRSRHAFTNDQWFGNGVNGIIDHTIASGITPNSQAPDQDFRAVVAERWHRWVDRCDADGLTDFGGQQAAAMQSVVVDGESYVHMGVTEAGELRLRLLNTDQLDVSLSRDLGNGRVIVNGVEYTAGVRSGFYVRPMTGPSLTPAANSVRVDISEVCQVFRPPFVGAVHGISWGASCLLGLGELGQLTDAMLVAAKVSAMLMGFVIDQSNSGGLPFEGQQIGSMLQGGLEPGTLKVLPAGFDVKFSTPQQALAGIEQAKLSLRGIAAGLGVPEYIVTGDLSAANYSSLRAARLGFARRCERFQNHQLIPAFIRPVYRRWLLLELLSGRIPLNGFVGDAEAWLAADFLTPFWPGSMPRKTPTRKSRSSKLD